MILGIDASNIRSGGGVTLVELLRVAESGQHGFDRVIVWCGVAKHARLPERPWLSSVHLPVLDRGLMQRSSWQRRDLARLARAAACSVLLVPGGSYAGDFHSVVTMSQNLLPFEWRELARFGWSWLAAKLMLLHFIQAWTFRRVDGLVFLTRYANDVVMKAVGETRAVTKNIPHGIDQRFARPPREQLAIGSCSVESPIASSTSRS